MPEPKKIPLFQAAPVVDLVPADEPVDPSKFALLLPIAELKLSEAEARRVQTYQQARLILGAAGASPMICSAGCPLIATCPLAAVKKHPLKQLCPMEANYVTQRFLEWLHEFDRTPETLSASERATVSTLVGLDVEELRCRSILAMAENAALTSLSVRDVDAESGEPISYEQIIHQNAVRITEIVTMRRMLLKDYELTPEQRTRKAKWLGLKSGDDLSSRQTDLMDKIKNRRRPVDVTAQ